MLLKLNLVHHGFGLTFSMRVGLTIQLEHIGFGFSGNPEFPCKMLANLRSGPECREFSNLQVSSLHWTILILFCVLFVQWCIFPSVHLLIACLVNINAHTHFEQNFNFEAMRVNFSF